MSDRIHLNIYRDWKGLNMGNSWWKNHYYSNMEDIEEMDQFQGWLHFLDIDTNPTITNTYNQDAGIDGSRFEYNVLSKTPIKLSFYFEFTDYEDYINKKHDVQSYFAAKAGFVIGTSFHPNIHACGYVSKVDIKPTSDHIAIFDVTMDNALGMWYSNGTKFMENNWSNDMFYDLRMPTNFKEVPSWRLKPGHNKIFIGGDVMSQLTNPIMDCNIYLYSVGDNVKVINHTSNTTLEANPRDYDGDLVWMNLNLGKLIDVDPKSHKITYKPFNEVSNSLDFWMDPGWNDIEVQGCDGGYLDTRFYYTNI